MKKLMIATITLAISGMATAKDVPQGWDFFRQVIAPCNFYTIQDSGSLQGALELVKENLKDGFDLVSVTKIDRTAETPVAPNHCVYTYVHK